MKVRWMGTVAVAALLVASVSAAQQPKVYASMVVTGTIGIQTDGSVSGYTLDKAEKLPPAALTALSRAIPDWKFEPVLRDGKAVEAKSYMSVRLVAKPIDGGYSIGVSGAHFGKSQTAKKKQDNTDIAYAKKHRGAPKYPVKAVARGVMGTVYLVVQVGRDGKVRHVAAEQVDLSVKGPSGMMKEGRQELAQSSMDWAKHLTFTVPTKGPEANQNHWEVRIPVTYRINVPDFVPGRHKHKWDYGQWQAYIPGPKHYIPWLSNQVAAQGGADAIPADGGLYPMQQSLHLLTPLGSGS